jgi:hypothetical protein
MSISTCAYEDFDMCITHIQIYFPPQANTVRLHDGDKSDNGVSGNNLCLF